PVSDKLLLVFLAATHGERLRPDYRQRVAAVVIAAFADHVGGPHSVLHHVTEGAHGWLSLQGASSAWAAGLRTCQPPAKAWRAPIRPSSVTFGSRPRLR